MLKFERRQVPQMVSDIYREVLKLTQEGNDIFFTLDTQFKTIQVRGYRGHSFHINRKPVVNGVAAYDNKDSLEKLMKYLKNSYRKERCYGPVTTFEENLEDE